MGVQRVKISVMFGDGSCTRRRLAGSGGAGQAVPARRRPAGEPAGTAGRHGAAVRRRQSMRIRQEILLGIGGLRALRAVGIEPTVCHMNEGHAAFLALERIRSHARARAQLSRGTRGHQRREHLHHAHARPRRHRPFDPKLVEQQLGWMARELGIGSGELLALGREHAEAQRRAVLHAAAGAAAGVPQQRRQQAARRGRAGDVAGILAWRAARRGADRARDQRHPHAYVDEPDHGGPVRPVPRAGVAGGDRGRPAVERIDEIPDAELWRVHLRRREWMIAAVRRRTARPAARDAVRRRRRSSAADEVLDPEALTIGFARRFAPYKRATLLFRDLDRFRKLITNKQRPVQFIFAGKAHPNDGAGKELIKQIAAVCSQGEFRRKVVFLENYDMSLARVMVQGVDVWLNNPLRLHEASGTSGMKVPANGGLNLSCLDGWWPEAYDGENGWAIGDGRVYDDLAYQDHVECESLYNLLEREIIPLFYERTADDLPRGWVARVKASMKTICPVFNTNRMLRDYTTKMYLPAATRARKVSTDGFSLAKSLATWKERIRRYWHEIRIADVQTDSQEILKVGDALSLRVKVHLGPISVDDIAVEVYHGPLNTDGEITSGHAARLNFERHEENGEHWFEGRIPCEQSGRNGFAVRVVPSHEDLADRYDQGLVVWG
jgi:starch phosphorylase